MLFTRAIPRRGFCYCAVQARLRLTGGKEVVVLQELHDGGMNKVGVAVTTYYINNTDSNAQCPVCIRSRKSSP